MTLVDTLKKVKAEYFLQTLGDVTEKALVYTLADTLPNTAGALVDTLAQTEVKAKTFGDILVDVKAKELIDTLSNKLLNAVAETFYGKMKKLRPRH